MKFVFRAEPLAVRKVLKSSMSGLTHLGLCQDDRGTIEIVLAEALNNVVEHAYAGQEDGVVELQLKRTDELLFVMIVDEGVAMPNEIMPRPKHHNLDGPVSVLPEGGFGWFLIHELTKDPSYSRREGKNIFSFQVALRQVRCN